MMNDTPRTFAILGHPLGHTMSPPIHRRLFELSGHPQSQYLIRDIAPQDLEREMPSLMALDGFNVTIPHKIPIMRYLDGLDDAAGRYQSVNVVEKRDGRFFGHNTDVDGFLRTMQAVGASLNGQVCLIGAGGVGRMFAIESVRQGAKLTIAVHPQNLEQTYALREEILSQVDGACVSITTCQEVRGEFDVMINATPAGMYPHTHAMPIPREALSGTKLLFDCIYNPTETLLMKTARQMGIPVVGGMAMLVWQAVSAHEIWDNAHYASQQIEQLIQEMVQKVGADFPLPDAPAGGRV